MLERKKRKVNARRGSGKRDEQPMRREKRVPWRGQRGHVSGKLTQHTGLVNPEEPRSARGKGGEAILLLESHKIGGCGSGRTSGNEKEIKPQRKEKKSFCIDGGKGWDRFSGVQA